MNSLGAQRKKPVSQRGLVLEADPFLLRLLLRIFERQFLVTGCSDLEEVADWRGFQFVIADVTLLTGEALAALRELSPDGPAVFLTGTSISQRLDDEIDTRGIAFIPKPFAPGELLTLVCAKVCPASERQYTALPALQGLPDARPLKTAKPPARS